MQLVAVTMTDDWSAATQSSAVVFYQPNKPFVSKSTS